MTLIASVQIPNLAIAVALRDQLALADHPLILYAAERQHTVVAAASDDTCVAVGMPLHQAITCCPQAVYQAADPERDRQACVALGSLLETFSPRVVFSMAGTDAIVDLDLGRIGIPKAIAVVQRLAQQIHTTLRLVPALGVATKRFVARRAAAVAGSGSAAVIPPGCEASFLAPQPIASLTVEAEMIERLQLFGLRTIGALAQLPLDALQAQFGARGRLLYQLARGGDDTPICMTIAPPALARTARFAGPLSDRTLLEAAIDRLVDRLATQLDADGWAAQAITLTLQVDDGVPRIAQRTLSAPTVDRSKLKEAFLALSRTVVLDIGIEALTLQFSELAPTVATQLELFSPAGSEPKQLNQTLERLSARYAGSFVRARLDDSSAQLPERRVRFDPLELA